MSQTTKKPQFCPFLLSGEITEATYENSYCRREQCAWWAAWEKACALVTLCKR